MACVDDVRRTIYGILRLCVFLNVEQQQQDECAKTYLAFGFVAITDGPPKPGV